MTYITRIKPCPGFFIRWRKKGGTLICEGCTARKSIHYWPRSGRAVAWIWMMKHEKCTEER